MRKSCYYLFLLPVLLFACSMEEASTKKEAKGGKVYGGTVVYESPEIVEQYFPLSCLSMYEQRAISPIYETLIKYDEESKELTGYLVSSYTISKDMKTIDLILRRGIFFHTDPCFKGKNEELTSKDVKFTLDFLCSPHKLNRQSQLLVEKIKGAKEFYDSFNADFSNGVAGIKVLSKYALRIELVNPSPSFLKILTHQSVSIFSKKAYQYYKEKLQHHPVGTGPFVLVSSNKNKRLYKRNDRYWRRDEHNNQLPFVDQIIVKHEIKNKGFNSFTTQKTDLLLSVPANQINSLFGTLDEAKNGKNILHKLQYRNGLKINYIGFNCGLPPFNNLNLRKAIFHAINKEQICSQFLYGESNPAENGILPTGSYFQPINPTERTYNMRLAKSYFRKSGYKGDSIVFFANVLPGSLEEDWCKSVVNELNKSLGLKMKLKLGTYNEKLISIQNGESKMWMGAYLPDYPDAESYLNPYYSLSEGKSIRTYGMYKNSKFDELYEKSTIEVDEKVRNQLFNSCIDIMNKEAPVVPVYFENILVVYNLNLRDANMNSFGIIDFSKAYIKPIK